MLCLAAPYGVQSTPRHTDGDYAVEILAPGVFAASLSRRPSVRLHRGHDGPMLCKVRPFETDKGIYFEYDDELPGDWTGFSVRFRVEEYRRLGTATFLVTQARLRHVAMLSGDSRPAYIQTRTAGFNPAVLIPG